MLILLALVRRICGRGRKMTNEYRTQQTEWYKSPQADVGITYCFKTKKELDKFNKLKKVMTLVICAK